MESGSPVFLILLPLVASLIAAALGRWGRAAAVIGIFAAILATGFLLLAAPGTGLFTDHTALVLGRSLELTGQDRALLLVIYSAIAILFILQAIRPTVSALVPAGLAALATLTAAFLITSPGVGAVFIAATLGLTMPVLYSGHYQAAAPAWRVFLFGIIGLAALLLVSWMQSTGQDSTDFGQAVLIVATLALLGGFPFHIWVRGAARSTNVAALAFGFGIVPLGVVTFLLAALDSSPAIRAAIEFQTALRWSVILTVLPAAFLIGHDRDWRALVATLILLDTGFLLVTGLATGTSALAVALAGLTSRILSLMLVGIGMTWMSGSGSRLVLWDIRQVPSLRLILILYGCFSLIGLPLTPGFAARWEQLALLGGSGLGTGWLVVLAALALAPAGWKVWNAGSRAESFQPADAVNVVAPGKWERVLALALLALAILLGLLPGLLMRIATWAATS